MGGETSSGGGADPQKNFETKTEPRSARYEYRFCISPPVQQNPEYAPDKHVKQLLCVVIINPPKASGFMSAWLRVSIGLTKPI